jgi:hypothetical protein
MPRFDIQINKTFVNANNDISFYESDEDHIQDTIQATKGSYKENPQDGVNIQAYLNSQGQGQTLAREIIVQLKSDLYDVNNPIVEITADSISVNPNATINI